jgi:hypothetical protein
VGSAFLVGHRRGITGQTSLAVAEDLGQVGHHLDPLPALGSQHLGFSLKLLGDQPVEQGRVLEPTTVIALEEIVQHDTACRRIGIDTNDDRATSEARTEVSVNTRRMALDSLLQEFFTTSQTCT